MADSSRSGERPATTSICPWCSAPLTEAAVVCPSCGANLVPDGDPSVPGVTAVDAASIMLSKAAPQQRSRLLAWITGEYQNDVTTSTESRAVAPPDLEVRREILRLELEAEVANLQAETDALLAEAAAEGHPILFADDEPAEGEAAASKAASSKAASDTGVAAESHPAEDEPPV